MGTQFAKLQNLDLHNLCSTQATDLTFSPDLTYNKVFCWPHFARDIPTLECVLDLVVLDLFLVVSHLLQVVNFF